MKDFIKHKLTSRKFILTVAGTLYFLVNGDAQLALAVILGYLGVEGAGDAMERFKKGDVAQYSAAQSPLSTFFDDDDEPDTSGLPISGARMFDESDPEEEAEESKA